MQNIIENTRLLIGKARLKEAIELIQNNFSKPDDIIFISLQYAKYISLSREKMIGTITSAEFLQRTAQINLALLEFLQDKEEDLQGPAPGPNTNLPPDRPIPALSDPGTSGSDYTSGNSARLTTSKFRILFVGSSPKDLEPIDVFQEFYNVKSIIGDHVELIEIMRATKAELQEQFNIVQPDIIHFSCHSNRTGVYLSDAINNKVHLNSQDLKSMLGLQMRWIECILFNSCESSKIGELVTQFNVKNAIVMNKKVKDISSIKYAESFYTRLKMDLESSEQLKINNSHLYARQSLSFEGLDDAFTVEIIKKEHYD